MSKSLDRLSLLSTFVRIAERGSISAAARDLGLSQASASRHLSELETRFGAVLIERTTHSLSLTEAGYAALEDARDLLNRWSSLRERFEDSTELSGTLRIIAPVALGQRHLIEATLDWQRAFPKLQINWQLDDNEVNLAETGADVWIRIGRPKDDRLVVRDLAEVERLLVTDPNLVESYEIKHPHDLAELPSVSLSPFEGEKLPLIHKNGARTTVQANGRLHTNNIFAALLAVSKGTGYAVMPKWLVASELEDGRLIDILPEWRAPTLTITACYLPSRRTSRALNAFLELVGAALIDLADV